ncbi:MAG: cytochrome c biogenesis protein CcsA [Verrucomicrobiota bacterium]
MNPKIGRWVVFGLLNGLLLVLFAAGLKEMRPEKKVVKVAGYEAWSEEVIEAARGIAVQEGGRAKPFETRAGFAMLSMRGDRSMKIEDGEGNSVKIGPVGWMLDLLFRPALAAQMPSFRVDNSEVLKAVGMEIDEKGKRDRYTFQEIEPFMGTLFQKAGDYEQLKADHKDLEPVQEQTLDLARAAMTYFYLSRYFDFVRNGVTLMPIDGDGQKVAMSTVMATAPSIVAAIRQNQGEDGKLPAHIDDLLRQIEQATQNSKFHFHPIPPTDVSEDKWYSVGELIEGTLIGTVKNPEVAITDVKRLEELTLAAGESQEAFARELVVFREEMLAQARKADRVSVERELSFNSAQWFPRALMVFGFAMLCLLFGQLAPASGIGRVLAKGVWVLSVLGTVMLAAAIVHRYLVILRPPVTNLYETIPFITVGMLGLALLTEVMTKKGLALGMMPVIGMGGTVLAVVFEVASASDSFDPLVAVLRSNFWLTTHVITITLGYAAGLLAAVMGFVYVFRRILGLDEGDQSERRVLTRMTYGTICFTLLLSMIGTILGGIWANDSWGRFWGWDPKENGALMIVLWSLFILHGRVGGLLKEWGINLAAAFGGSVVTFSWFHVNMLGTGLHSYGFTDGKSVIWWFYGTSAFIILTGIAYAMWERDALAKRKAQERLRKESEEELRGEGVSA